MFLGHTVDECAVFVAFLSDRCRQSFDPKLSEVSLFLFPALVGMLSLLDEC